MFPGQKGLDPAGKEQGFFKAAFVSIGSQVQPGEQRVSDPRGTLGEPNQLILRLVSASWVTVSKSPDRPCQPRLAQL